MTVSELIHELQQLPQDAKVFHYWESGLRTDIDFIYLDINGNVVTGDFDEPIDDERYMPLDKNYLENNKNIFTF